jgi:hypothetical protein
MLAAIIVVNTRPGPSWRPATKKSLLPRTSRADQSPSSTMAAE